MTTVMNMDIKTLDFSISRTALATLDMTMTKPTLATREHHAPGAHHRTRNQQYLIFLLADECYGLDLLKVRAICGWTPVKAVASLPVVIPGVLNLNGSVVPLIDLRVRFGLAHTYEKTTAVIVTRTLGEYGKRDIGMVVDGVSDVIQVPINQVQPVVPQAGGAVDSTFINGQVSAEAGRVMLMDVDHLLSTSELLKLVVS